MKTPFRRRWYTSLFTATQSVSHERRRRQRQPLGLEPLEDRVTPTLTPQMLLDINTTTLSSDPQQLVSIGSITYFVADDGLHGLELWKSDGTAAGTVLVKDINPGATGSDARYLTNVNGTLFFSANDGTTGLGLWKSDGTAAGTVLVKDTTPGGAGISPSNLTNGNGTLFFSAYQEATGWELWKSDGTASGTRLVKDIKAGWPGSYPTNLTNVNGTLFFTSVDYFGTFSELWKSDGTAAGTVRVKDFIPSPFNGAAPTNLTNVNGTLFFSLQDETNGYELWKSDGTAGGTRLVKDIYPGIQSSSPRNLTNVNGTLFFTANDGTGEELWKSNGTAAGTVLVKDIYPGQHREYGYYGGWWYVPNSSSPDGLTNVDGTLFFVANDGTTGRELWKSDGTEAGTTLVRDIRPGGDSAYPDNFTNVNGTLFLSANDGTTGYELWKSDGTASGTVLVKDIFPGQHREYGYFGGWWYEPNSSTPDGLTNVNGTLFYMANDGTTGYELWKSDGTASGTVLVKDIRPGSGNSYPGDDRFAPGSKTVVNGTLFFSANDGTHGRELWKSDGTTTGTVLVKDIYPGVGSNYTGPSLLTDVNGTVFFTTYSGSAAPGLWQSDGNAAGTELVVERWVGNLAAFNGTLCFTMDDAIHGMELWTLVDDQTQGTSLDVTGSPSPSPPGWAARSPSLRRTPTAP